MSTEKLAVEQIRNSLKRGKDLELKAEINREENFRHAFEPNFDVKVIYECHKNKIFIEKY